MNKTIAVNNPLCLITRMARTAAASRGRKKAPTLEPLEEYLRLDYYKQLVCWNYFQFAATQGQQGWNPDEAGSVFHYRSSAYVQSLGSGSWFRHVAKQMVTLAQKFAQQQLAPPKPTGGLDAPAIGANEITPQIPVLPSLLPRNKPVIASSRTAAAPPIMRTPRSPATPGGRNQLDLGPANNASVIEQGGEYPALPYPVTFGFYTQFDYTSRKKVGRVLVRMLTHGAVELQDIEYEWVTPRVLKIRVAWPEWFQYAEQMAMFVIDTEGQPKYPPDHPVTEDMAANNMALVDENTKRVWDEGYIKFDRDMKEDEFSIERLNIRIPSKGTKVKGIQFCAS